MNVFVNWLGYVEIVLCLTVLCLILVRRRWKDFWTLGMFAGVRAVSETYMELVQHHVIRIGPISAYRLYFSVFWYSFAIEFALAALIVYSILRITVAPFRGLRKIGMVIFCGSALLGVLVSLESAFGPHRSQITYMVASISHLEWLESLLTLGVMVFVSFAVRPLGLSYRSPAFGVGVGLALMAVSGLIQRTWLTHHSSTVVLRGLMNSLIMCAAATLWTIYFAMREPGRREVILPESSVFGRLDRVGIAWSPGG